MKKEKTEDRSAGENKSLITVPIIQKEDPVTGSIEIYLQRSIADYFVKFCESKVSRDDLDRYIASRKSSLVTAKLEVEFRKGDWDICTEDDESLGRIGDYAIIHRIIE